MANEKNLVPFKNGEDDRRNKNGRPPGSLSRSTIARKWLEATEKYMNPQTGIEGELTQEDIITLEQIKEARQGKNKTQAYIALMDSAHGRPITTISVDPESSVNINWVNTFKPPEEETKPTKTKKK